MNPSLTLFWSLASKVNWPKWKTILFHYILVLQALKSCRGLSLIHQRQWEMPSFCFTGQHSHQQQQRRHSLPQFRWNLWLALRQVFIIYHVMYISIWTFQVILSPFVAKITHENWTIFKEDATISLVIYNVIIM